MHFTIDMKMINLNMPTFSSGTLRIFFQSYMEIALQPISIKKYASASMEL